MPLFSDPEPFEGVSATPPEAVPDSPGATETVGAAFRLENPVASFFASEKPLSFKFNQEPVDPDYDPFADIEGYEENARSFKDANSQDEVSRIKRDIDREREDMDTISRAGAGGFAATMAAGFLDPVILIPGAGVVGASVKAGSSVLKTGLATARAGLVASGASEALLHATQETRTPVQSAINISGATLLSGLLGGGVRALTVRKFNKAAAQLEDDLNPRDADPINPGEVKITQEMLDADTSVGAAQTERTTLAEEALKSALGVEKLLSKTSPMLRTATSPSIEVRRAAQKLIETPFIYEKNRQGIATPVSVETRVKGWQAGLGTAIEELDALFVKYRTGGAGGRARRATIGAGDIFRGETPGRSLKFNEFKAEIGRAMRRGDEHEIPEVAEAAKRFRELVFEPLKNRAIKAKLLPEDVDVETAVSYLTRVYDVDRINAERTTFREIISEWFKGQRAKAQETLETREGDLGVAQSRAERSADPEAIKKVQRELESAREQATLAKAEDVELDDMADQIIDSILGTPNGRVPYEPVSLARGPLKERTFSIDDELIEPFLLDDIEILSRFYVRTLAPDVELAQTFGKPDLESPFGKVIDDYNKRATAATSDRDRIALSRRREADLKDLEALRDRLRGTYAAPADPNAPLVRGFRVIRNWNYLRILGGVLINSLPDVARPVMTQGLWRTFKHGIVPLITNLKGVKLAGKEAKMAGTAWDMALDTRALSIAELGDDFSRQTKLEKGLQGLSANFSLVNLLAPWNAMMKQWSATIIQARIVEASQAWAKGTIKKGDLEKLAAGGIDRGLAVKIAEQFKTHGTAERGLRLANTRSWTDREAVRAFRAALSRDVDIVIVSPGVGDRPLWMSTEVGKIIGQFRSFAFSATQRVLIAGLQQRDAAVLNGMALTLGMGAMVYFLKTKNSGREVSGAIVKS